MFELDCDFRKDQKLGAYRNAATPVAANLCNRELAALSRIFSLAIDNGIKPSPIDI